MDALALEANLNTAINLHNAGRIAEAERLYRAVLQASPEHPEALHHLGILAVQCGHAEMAIKLIGRAAELKPSPGVFNNLGESHRAMGRHAEAIACYRKALELDGNQTDAMANMGVALAAQKKTSEAEPFLRQALAINPDHVGALVGLAALLSAKPDHDQALEIWLKVIKLRPNEPVLRRSLGVAWTMAGDPYRGLVELRRSLELRPDVAETHAKMALAYEQIGKVPEAILEARKAVELLPDKWEAHYDLAQILQRSGDHHAAVESYERATKFRPPVSTLYGAYGSALLGASRLPEAVDAFKQGIALDPTDGRLHAGLSTVYYGQADYAAAVRSAADGVRLIPHEPDSHSALAFALLASGDFEEGFKEYEWRWRDASFPQKPRNFERPLWDGSDLRGRRILVHSEQGFGDVFQFLRYLLMVRALGATVIVEANYKVAQLVRQMPADFNVYITGTMLPDFDLHVPMMSLPTLLGTTKTKIPCTAPYLSADPKHVARWHQRLEPMEGLKVGLVWAGNKKPDPKRSALLADLAPLRAVAGVTLISMQPPPQSDELNNVPDGLRLEDLGPELRDFSDTTASLLANLDLLITIDTGVAHLAGAMGVQTWVMLPRSRDWRWVLDEETTRWYPTVRLFRQSKRDDWSDVVERVAAELRVLAV